MISFEKKKIKYIIKKKPMCDTCVTEIHPTGNMLLSYPAKIVYCCPKCKKTYYFRENELEDEIVYENVEE